MPCTSVRIKGRILQLSKMDVAIMSEALRLMGWKTSTDMKKGTVSAGRGQDRLIVRTDPRGIRIEVEDGTSINDAALVQTYTALVHVALLKKQGYTVEAKRENGTIMISGRR